jgi:hypothetical protein
MVLPDCNPSRKWKQEDLEFEASWGYIGRPCIKTNKQTKINQKEKKIHSENLEYTVYCSHLSVQFITQLIPLV